MLWKCCFGKPSLGELLIFGELLAFGAFALEEASRGLVLLLLGGGHQLISPRHLRGLWRDGFSSGMLLGGG